MNGATEATLSDLLATAQAMNVNMIKLQQLVRSSGSNLGSGSGGGSSGGTGGGSPASLLASLNPVGVAFNVVKGAASAVGAVFGVMGNILGQVVGAATGLVKSLYNLGVATAISGTKISEFYDAFKNVPLLGIGFGIMADVMRYQEQLLEFFQQIAMSGASFSGSLTQMRAAASRSYMSMQDFATVVRENSETFGLFGGTVTTSINKFVDVQNRLLGPRSQYANMMYGMGFTAKTTGDLLAYYMKMQSMVNKSEQQSTEEIIKGTAEYAKELNLLSQLTGKNNEKLKKEADEIAKEEAYRMYLTTIGATKAKDEMAVITNLTQVAGKEIAEMYRDSYAGVLARTEDQRRVGAMLGQPLYDFLTNIRRMTNAGASQAQLTEYARQESLKLSGIAKQTAQSFQGIGPAMSPFYKVLIRLVEFGQSQGNLTQLNKNEADVKKKQAEAAKSQAADLEKAQQAMRNFGEQMLMLAYQIIRPLIPYLQKFANFTVDLVRHFGSLATELTKKEGFKDAITGIANWFSTTFNSLKKSSDPKDFFNRLGTQLNVAFDAMKPALMSFMEKVAEIMKPFMIQMVDYVADAANAWLFSVVGARFGAEDPAQRERNREVQRGLSSRLSAIETMRSQYNSKKSAAPDSEDTLNFKRSLDEMTNRLYADLTRLVEGPNSSTKRWAESQRAALGAQRHSGTLGMTGNWWEKSDANLNVQAGESVVTQAQMSQIVGAAGQNGLAESIQQLNSLVALQVKYAKETAEYARRNVDATRSLDGNLFARA
jgi:hypothetical protein